MAHFFASFPYATHEQIGWDPTVSVLTDDPENSQDDITVRFKKDCLSYPGPPFISWIKSSVRWRHDSVEAIRLEHGESLRDSAIHKDPCTAGDALREGCIFHKKKMTADSETAPPGYNATAVQMLSHCRFKVHH